MTRYHLSVNIITGQKTTTPFTSQEEAAADAYAADPVNFPITMRQLRLGLLGAGYPADFIATVIAAIPDATQRGAALIWYEETSIVHWDHSMTQALIAAAGISDSAAKAMWIGAKDLAA